MEDKKYAFKYLSKYSEPEHLKTIYGQRAGGWSLALLEEIQRPVLQDLLILEEQINSVGLSKWAITLYACFIIKQ